LDYALYSKAQLAESRVNDRQLKLPFDTITVKISVAVQITGIGRTKMYELINDGQIEAIKVGTATLIPVDSLRRFLMGCARSRRRLRVKTSA
jgi:excisionase family DNA binding protein